MRLALYTNTMAAQESYTAATVALVLFQLAIWSNSSESLRDLNEILFSTALQSIATSSIFHLCENLVLKNIYLAISYQSPILIMALFIEFAHQICHANVDISTEVEPFSIVNWVQQIPTKMNYH